MKLVLIEWYDSHFQPNEWCNRKYIEIVKRPPCISAGVILKETESEILLCPNLTETDGAQGITIPKVCIKRIRPLKVKNA